MDDSDRHVGDAASKGRKLVGLVRAPGAWMAGWGRRPRLWFLVGAWVLLLGLVGIVVLAGPLGDRSGASLAGVEVFVEGRILDLGTSPPEERMRLPGIETSAGPPTRTRFGLIAATGPVYAASLYLITMATGPSDWRTA